MEDSIASYDLSNNRKLKIFQSNDVESPREWCNLTTMIFFGNYSHLGDEHNMRSEDHNGWDEMEKAIMKEYDVACIKKVYGYSHSGLTISLKPFSCQWDSGVLGFAIITKEALRENYMMKRLSSKAVKNGYKHILNEIVVLDQYVTGDVYGFQVIEYSTCDQEHTHEEVEDSCWGFYGSNILENGILDHLQNEEDIKAVKKAEGVVNV